MLPLTPLENTVAGQELIQQSLEKGELIAEIRMAQRVLKHPLTSRDTLAQKSLDELHQLLRQLEAELD